MGMYNHTKLRGLINTMTLVAPDRTLNGYNTLNSGALAEEFCIQLTGKNLTQIINQYINNIIGTNFYLGLRPDQQDQISRLVYLLPGNQTLRGDPAYDIFVEASINITLLELYGEFVFRTGFIFEFY